MKSKKIMLEFSESSSSQWGEFWKEVTHKEFFNKKEIEANRLMRTDTKVHIKKIAESTYKLLKYAGYADSRKTIDNRDSIRNSQQLVVYSH